MLGLGHREQSVPSCEMGRWTVLWDTNVPSCELGRWTMLWDTSVPSCELGRWTVLWDMTRRVCKLTVMLGWVFGHEQQSVPSCKL